MSFAILRFPTQKLWPSIATPVIVKDRVVIAYGRNDRNIPRLHGVRLSGLGDVTDSNHVWDRDDIGTFVPTPVAYKERVYMVRDRGEIECIDPKDGTSIWSDRLPKGRAKFYASPLIAGGVLYAPREGWCLWAMSRRKALRFCHSETWANQLLDRQSQLAMKRY